MKWILILLITFSLMACESLLVDGSPFAEVPLNSRLVLKQELEIPSGQVAVFLQDGKIVTAAAVRVRQPNCKFEIRTIEDRVRKVMPDEFRIIRYFLDRNFVSSGKIMVASVGMVISSAASATAEVYTTEMFLHSDMQPDVLRLSCEHWEDPADGEYLTLDQIKQALGQVIQFN